MNSKLMSNNPHRQFPGKMDKMNKKSYKKGYKKATHGNVKEGYGKLKHVKMFESFDEELSEVKAEAVATKNLRITKKFAKKVDDMIELAKKFDKMKEEYTVMAKLLGKYEDEVQAELEKYGAQFIRIGAVAIELKKLKGRETKSYKAIAEALEALLPATEEMQEAIKNIEEINTKINPDKIKMEYSVQEGVELDEKMTYDDLLKIGAPITGAIGRFIKKLGGWFKNMWNNLKDHVEFLTAKVDDLDAKLKPLGVDMPSTTEALKMMGQVNPKYSGGMHDPLRNPKR